MSYNYKFWIRYNYVGAIWSFCWGIYAFYHLCIGIDPILQGFCAIIQFVLCYYFVHRIKFLKLHKKSADTLMEALKEVQEKLEEEEKEQYD
jgi:hypothetical protein